MKIWMADGKNLAHSEAEREAGQTVTGDPFHRLYMRVFLYEKRIPMLPDVSSPVKGECSESESFKTMNPDNTE